MKAIAMQQQKSIATAIAIALHIAQRNMNIIYRQAIGTREDKKIDGRKLKNIRKK